MQLILVDLDYFVSSFTKPWGFPFEFWHFLLSSVVWDLKVTRNQASWWLAQWWRIHLPTQVKHHGCDPRSGPRHGAMKPVRHNTESVSVPGSCDYWSPHARQPVLPKRSRAVRSPCPHEEQPPRAAESQRKARSNEDSAQPKKKEKVTRSLYCQKVLSMNLSEDPQFCKASEQTNNCLYNRQKTENGMVKDLITTDKEFDYVCDT